MASNQTANFGLNQWNAEDKVLREEFNADNAKIDAAIAEKATVYLGTYTGNGEAEREISLGYRPKLIFVWLANAAYSGSQYFTNRGIATDFGSHKIYNSLPVVQLTDSGFRVFETHSGNYDVYTNTADTLYCYLALV